MRNVLEQHKQPCNVENIQRGSCCCPDIITARVVCVGSVRVLRYIVMCNANESKLRDRGLMDSVSKNRTVGLIPLALASRGLSPITEKLSMTPDIRTYFVALIGSDDGLDSGNIANYTCIEELKLRLTHPKTCCIYHTNTITSW